MATLDLQILNAAHEDNLIPKRLTARQKLYLQKSILTANQIYWAIAEDEGIDFESLERKLGVNENTLKQYARWMIGSGIIYADATGSGGKYYLFTKERRTIVKTK